VAASGTVSIRLSLDGAQEIKRALETVGNTSSEALAKIKSSLGQISQGGQIDGLTNSTRNLNTQMRLLGVQSIQGFSGLATGQPILTTLIQQGHQVVDSMLATGTSIGQLASRVAGFATSATGLATILGGGLVASFAALTVSGEHSLAMLAEVQQSLRGNHADFEALGQTVVDVSRRIASTSGLGLTDAVKIAQQFAGNRYFAGTATDLERLSRAAIDLGASLGTDAAGGMKVLDDAMSNPAKSAQDLASKFSQQLTPSVRDYIKSLQDSGHQSEAFEAVLKAIETGASGAARNGLGPISKAWQDLGNAFTSSTDGWRPFTTWLANDFAQAIRDVTGLVNSLKDAWAGLKSLGDYLPKVSSDGLTDAADAAVRQRMAQQQSRNSLAPSAGSLPSPNDVGGTGILPQSGAAIVQSWPTLTASASKQAFVDTWLDAAKTAGARLGVAPEIILSQLGLETGYGRSAYNYNLGNIKATGNEPSFVNPGDGLRYRSYASPDAFMSDYTSLLQRKFPGVVGTGSDVNAFSSALNYGKPGGYAEDPRYGDKLASTLNRVSGLTANAGASSMSLDDLIQRVGVVTGGGQFVGSSSGMLNNSKALTEAIDAARKATEDFKATNLVDLLEAVHKKQDEVAASAGRDSAEYRQLSQVEQNLVAQISANADARTKEQRSAESQLRATSGLTTAEQALNAALEQRRQALIAAGQAFTDTDAEQVRNNVLDQQLQKLQQLEFQMSTTGAKNRELTDAYNQGNQAVINVTAQQQAYDKALELFGQNIPKGKLDELTDFYKTAAREAGEAAVAQQNLNNRDTLAFIKAETSTLGENEQARSRQLAVMQAEQEMHRKFGDILPQRAQDYIALKGAISDATVAYQHQQAVTSELSNFFTNTFDTIGNSIVQAFATGEASALKFKDIAKSVVQALLNEFLKLAVLNPLKNFLFGEDSKTVTLTDVIGRLFGGSSSIVGSSTGGALTESAAAALFNAGGVTLNSSGEVEGATASSGLLGSGSSLGGAGGLLGGLGTIDTLYNLGEKLFGGSGSTSLITGLGGKIATASH
jgi:flagellum-specific peptidoglycan hydrolase FlgJ